MNRTLKAFVAAVISFTLVFQQTGFAQVAPQLPLPLYLSRIALPTDALRPDLVRGLSVDEKGLTNLLLVPGNGKPLSSEQVSIEQKTFSDYLSIGLALPDANFWVNLRPDSPDKVIDPLLAQTDLGKVLLEADLQLKKDLAALTNPATPEGTQYWNKLYQRAEQLFPNENVEIPTYNRPWIVPGEVILKENNNGVLIYKANLKVMLERDHLKSGDVLVYAGNDDPRLAQLNDYSSQLIRDHILPRLTVLVNSSKRYAQLRQVFNALILAQWMKARIRQSSGKEDISSLGFESKKLDNLRSTAAWQPKTYFDQYAVSFSKGEYSKEEAVSTPSGITVRRYFSGGINFDGGSTITRWTATALFGGLSLVMLRSAVQAAYVGEQGTAALTAAAGLASGAAAATVYKRMGRDGGSVPDAGQSDDFKESPVIGKDMAKDGKNSANGYAFLISGLSMILSGMNLAAMNDPLSGIISLAGVVVTAFGGLVVAENYSNRDGGRGKRIKEVVGNLFKSGKTVQEGSQEQKKTVAIDNVEDSQEAMEQRQREEIVSAIKGQVKIPHKEDNIIVRVTSEFRVSGLTDYQSYPVDKPALVMYDVGYRYSRFYRDVMVFIRPDADPLDALEILIADNFWRADSDRKVEEMPEDERKAIEEKNQSILEGLQAKFEMEKELFVSAQRQTEHTQVVDIRKDGGRVTRIEADSELAKEFQNKSWNRYQMIQQVARLESRHTPSEYMYVMKDTQSNDYLLVLTFVANSKEIPLDQMSLGQDKVIADAAIAYVSKSQAFARDLLKNNRVTVGYFGPSGPEKLLNILKQQAYDGGDQALLLKNLAFDEKMREGVIDNLNLMNLVLSGRLESARKKKASQEEVDALVKALSENVLKTADIQDESAAFMKGLFKDLAGDDFSRKIFALEQFAAKLYTNERFTQRLQQTYWDEALPLFQKIAVEQRISKARDLAQDILLRLASFKGLKALNATILLASLSHPDFRVRVKAADAIRAADKELSSTISAAASDEARMSFSVQLQQKLDQADKDGGINSPSYSRSFYQGLNAQEKANIMERLTKMQAFTEWVMSASSVNEFIGRLMLIGLLGQDEKDTDFDYAVLMGQVAEYVDLMEKNEGQLLKIMLGRSELQDAAAVVLGFKGDGRTLMKLRKARVSRQVSADPGLYNLVESVIDYLQNKNRDGGSGKTEKKLFMVRNLIEDVNSYFYGEGQPALSQRESEELLWQLQRCFTVLESEALPFETESGLRDLNPGDILFYSDYAGAHQAVCLGCDKDLKVDYLRFDFPPIPLEIKTEIVNNVPLDSLRNVKVLSLYKDSERSSFDGGKRAYSSADDVLASAMGDVLISFMEARRGMPREKIAEELKPVLRAYLAQIPDGLSLHVEEAIENDPIRESLTLDLGDRSDPYFTAVQNIAGIGQTQSIIKENRGSVNLKKLAAIGSVLLLGVVSFFGLGGHYSYSKQESDIVMGKTDVASDLSFVLEHGFGKNRADVMRQVTDDAVSGALAQGDVFNVPDGSSFNPIRQDIELRNNLLAVVNNTEQDSSIRVESVTQLGRMYGYLFKKNEVFVAQFEAIVNANHNESYNPFDTDVFNVVYTEITDKLIDVALNDHDPAVRAEAVKQLGVALAVSHDSEVKWVLRDLAAYDRDPAVMDAAQQALKDGGSAAEIIAVLESAKDKEEAESRLLPVLKAYQRSQFEGVSMAGSDLQVIKDLESDIEQDLWRAVLRLDVPEAARIRQIAEAKGFVKRQYHPLVETFKSYAANGFVAEESGRSAVDTLKVLGVSAAILLAGISGAVVYDDNNYSSDEATFMLGWDNNPLAKFPHLFVSDDQARLEMINQEPISDIGLLGITIIRDGSDGQPSTLAPQVRIAAIKKIVANAQNNNTRATTPENCSVIVKDLIFVSEHNYYDMSVRAEATSALGTLSTTAAYSHEESHINAYLSSVALNKSQDVELRKAALNGIFARLNAINIPRVIEQDETMPALVTIAADKNEAPQVRAMVWDYVIDGASGGIGNYYGNICLDGLRDVATEVIADRSDDPSLRKDLMAEVAMHWVDRQTPEEGQRLEDAFLSVMKDPRETAELREKAMSWAAFHIGRDGNVGPAIIQVVLTTDDPQLGTYGLEVLNGDHIRFGGDNYFRHGKNNVLKGGTDESSIAKLSAIAHQAQSAEVRQRAHDMLASLIDGSSLNAELKETLRQDYYDGGSSRDLQLSQVYPVLDHYNAVYLLVGHGSRKQFNKAQLSELKAQLDKDAEALDKKHGKGRWMFVYGGDPYYPEAPDIGFVADYFAGEHGVPIMMVQRQADKKYGVPDFVSYAYFYPDQTDKNGRNLYGGVDEEGNPVAATKFYLGEDFIKHGLKGILAYGGGFIAAQEVGFAVRQGVPVEYRPSVVEIMDESGDKYGQDHKAIDAFVSQPQRKHIFSGETKDGGAGILSAVMPLQIALSLAAGGAGLYYGSKYRHSEDALTAAGIGGISSLAMIALATMMDPTSTDAVLMSTLTPYALPCVLSFLGGWFVNYLDNPQVAGVADKIIDRLLSQSGQLEKFRVDGNDAVESARAKVKMLLSKNPFLWRKAWRELSTTKNLLVAAELLKVYPQAKGVVRFIIRELYREIVFKNFDISAEPEGFGYYGAEKRAKEIVRMIEMALPRINDDFGGTDLVIRQEGAINEDVGAAVFKAIKDKVNVKSFIVARPFDRLVMITEEKSGNLGIFLRGPGDELLLVQAVVQGQLWTKEQLDGSAEAGKLVSVSAEYSRGTVAGGYSIEAVDLVSPWAGDYAHGERRLSFERHEIGEPLAPGNEAQVAILENVLRPGQNKAYLLKRLSEVGARTPNRGVVLVVNDIRTYDGLISIGTIFQRQGDALKAISRSYHGWNEGFEMARMDESIEEVVIDSKDGGLSGFFGKIKFGRQVKKLSSADASAREEAAIALGELMNEGAIEPLKAALKDASPKVRTEAVNSLSKLGTDACIEAIVPMLDDADPSVRSAAFGSLEKAWGGKNGSDPRLVDMVVKMIQDKHYDVSYDALQAVQTYRIEQAVMPLNEVLHNAGPDDWGLVMAALKAIQTFKDVRNVQSVSDVVKKEFESKYGYSDLQRLFEMIRETLAVLGVSGAVIEGLFTDELVHAWPHRRDAAFDLMGTNDAQAAIDILLPLVGEALVMQKADRRLTDLGVSVEQLRKAYEKALESNDQSVRYFAAFRLKELQDKQSVVPLAKAFYRETNERNKKMIGTAINRLGGSSQIKSMDSGLLGLGAPTEIMILITYLEALDLLSADQSDDADVGSNDTDDDSDYYDDDSDNDSSYDFGDSDYGGGSDFGGGDFDGGLSSVPAIKESVALLKTRNPLSWRKAEQQLSRTRNLLAASELKKIYPQGNRITKRIIERLYKKIVFRNAGVSQSGTPDGYRVRGVSSKESVKNVLKAFNHILPRLKDDFGDTPLVVRQEGVINDAVSVAVFNGIKNKINLKKFVSARPSAEMVFINEEKTGKVGVFLHGKDGVLDLVQMIGKDGMWTKEQLAGLPDAEMFSLVGAEYARGAVSPGYSIEKMSLVSPQAQAYAQKEKRLVFEQHDIRQPLFSPDSQAQLTILSNVLHPERKDLDIFGLMATVGANVPNKGIVIALNEDTDYGDAICLGTVFQRQGDVLKAIAQLSHMWNEGFEFARMDESIKEISLSGKDGGSAAPGAIGSEEARLDAELKEKRIAQLKDIAALLYQIYADENIKIELKDTEDNKISFDPQYGRKQLSVPLSADPAMVLAVTLQFESEPWKRHVLERYFNELMHQDGDVTAGAVSPYADGGRASQDKDGGEGQRMLQKSLEGFVPPNGDIRSVSFSDKVDTVQVSVDEKRVYAKKIGSMWPTISYRTFDIAINPEASLSAVVKKLLDNEKLMYVEPEPWDPPHEFENSRKRDAMTKALDGLYKAFGGKDVDLKMRHVSIEDGGTAVTHKDGGAQVITILKNAADKKRAEEELLPVLKAYQRAQFDGLVLTSFDREMLNELESDIEQDIWATVLRLDVPEAARIRQIAEAKGFVERQYHPLVETFKSYAAHGLVAEESGRSTLDTLKVLGVSAAIVLAGIAGAVVYDDNNYSSGEAFFMLGFDNNLFAKFPHLFVSDDQARLEMIEREPIDDTGLLIITIIRDGSDGQPSTLAPQVRIAAIKKIVANAQNNNTRATTPENCSIIVKDLIFVSEHNYYDMSVRAEATSALGALSTTAAYSHEASQINAYLDSVALNKSQDVELRKAALNGLAQNADNQTQLRVVTVYQSVIEDTGSPETLRLQAIKGLPGIGSEQSLVKEKYDTLTRVANSDAQQSIRNAAYNTREGYINSLIWDVWGHSLRLGEGEYYKHARATVLGKFGIVENSQKDGGKADLSTAKPGIAVDNLGGVDFRATLNAAQVNPANTPAVTAAIISQIATQAAFQVRDLAVVQKQLLSRISQARNAQELPLQELKECLAVCSQAGEKSGDTAEAIATCLLNILQQEEARGMESSAQVQELLSFAEACQA